MQIIDSKGNGIVDNMDYEAWNNAFRAQVNPTENDSEHHGIKNFHQPSVNQTESKSSDENGNPRATPHFKQTAKKDASKTNLFCNWAEDAK